MEKLMKLEDLKKSLLKKRFTNELEYITEAIKTNEPLNLFGNAKSVNLEQRQRLLQVIISKIALNGELNKFPPNHEKNNDNRKESTQTTMARYFSKIDNNIYKKLWAKLPPFHKCIKIKEYIDDTYGTGKMQTEIIEQLSKLVHNGELTKKQHIVYDPNDEKILSIPILIVSDGSYNLKIN